MYHEYEYLLHHEGEKINEVRHLVSLKLNNIQALLSVHLGMMIECQYNKTVVVTIFICL